MESGQIWWSFFRITLISPSLQPVFYKRMKTVTRTDQLNTRLICAHRCERHIMPKKKSAFVCPRCGPIPRLQVLPETSELSGSRIAVCDGEDNAVKARPRHPCLFVAVQANFASFQWEGRMDKADVDQIGRNTRRRLCNRIKSQKQTIWR